MPVRLPWQGLLSCTITVNSSWWNKSAVLNPPSPLKLSVVSQVSNLIDPRRLLVSIIMVNTALSILLLKRLKLLWHLCISDAVGKVLRDFSLCFLWICLPSSLISKFLYFDFYRKFMDILLNTIGESKPQQFCWIKGTHLHITKVSVPHIISANSFFFFFFCQFLPILNPLTNGQLREVMGSSPGCDPCSIRK